MSSLLSKTQEQLHSATHSSVNPSVDRRLNPGGKLRVLAACYSAGEYAHSEGLLACVEQAWGLKGWLQGMGHELIITSDCHSSDSEFDRHLGSADVVITQPFWPVYLREERLRRASKLALVLTAGVGSDHIDLDYCRAHGITVAEISGSNAVSVAEHTVLSILALLKQFPAAQKQVVDGEWNIAAISSRAHDLQGKKVGLVAVGRIGQAVIQRLSGFGVQLHYYARHQQSWVKEKRLGLTYHSTLESLVRAVDILSIHAPATKQTEDMFDEQLLRQMKKGAYLINTARGKIVNRDALAKVVKEGHLAGYAGDVWEPEPAPSGHPWRSLPLHAQAMTPHISGDSLDAQQRIADGLRTVLQAWLTHQPIPESFIMANPDEDEEVSLLDKWRAQLAASLQPASSGAGGSNGQQQLSAAQQHSEEVKEQERTKQQALPLVIVFGATGNQGGSVARALHSSGKYRLRGVTRNPESESAKQLQVDCPGFEWAKADMLDLDALHTAMKGAWAVFCVTNFYTERNLDKAKQGKLGELDEGATVAQAAADVGVIYFLMSSLANVEELTDGRWMVSHFTGKKLVADRARELGLRVIEVQPGVFCQNWSSGLFPMIEPQLDGSIVWRLPVRHDVALPLIDIDQMGEYVAAVLADPQRWDGKHVLCAAEYLTLDQAAAVYADVSGQRTVYKRQTMDEYRAANSKLPYVDEYVEQFSYFNEFGYYDGESLRDTIDNFPATRTFRQWLLHSGWRTQPSTLGKLAQAVLPSGDKAAAPHGQLLKQAMSNDAAHEKREFELSGGEKRAEA